MQNIKRGKIPMTRPRHCVPKIFSVYMCFGSAIYGAFAKRISEPHSTHGGHCTAFTRTRFASINPHTRTIFDERSLCRLRCRRCRYFDCCSVSLSTHIFTFAQSQNFIFMFTFFCVVAVSQRTSRARGTTVLSIYDTRKNVCAAAAAIAAFIVVAGVFFQFQS